MEINKIEPLIKKILVLIGEDPEREGLKETPHRVARMYEEIFAGYKTPVPVLKSFKSSNNSMITKRGIRVYSMCEHHIIPMILDVSFAYIPKGRVVGISKIIRLIRWCTSRLVIQEDLAENIIKEFEKQVSVKGCMCIITGVHLCETMRGVRTENNNTHSAISGVFSKLAVRTEALALMSLTMKID